MAIANLVMIQGVFCDARAVIAVATDALEATEDYGDISSALRSGLRIFQAAYDALDTLRRLS